MTLRHFQIACALLAAPGLVEVAVLEFAGRSFHRNRSIDQQYEALISYLPSGARVGFLTDDPFDPDPYQQGSERYFHALYALAPRSIVLDDARADVWVADFYDPGKLADLCRLRGLVQTAAFDGGHLAVLRRKGAP